MLRPLRLAQGLSRLPFHSPTPSSIPKPNIRSMTTPSWRAPVSRRLRLHGQRHSSNQAQPPPPPPNPTSSKSTSTSTSMSARLKDLSKKYGWAALGVYLGLSALDFPFCFLAVRLLGPQRVAEAEHVVVQGFWSAVGAVVPSWKPAPGGEGTSSAGLEGEGALVGEDAMRVQAQHGGASIWTQLILAYGVHKSLIFFRVPLTAAVTPNVVKYLRKRGWKIGNPSAT